MCFYHVIISLTDELEMKLEWVSVGKKRKNNNALMLEKEIQSKIPKHRKDIDGLKTIIPTPKTPYEK